MSKLSIFLESILNAQRFSNLKRKKTIIEKVGGWMNSSQLEASQFVALGFAFRSTETIAKGAQELSKQASADLTETNEEPAKSDAGSELFG